MRAFSAGKEAISGPAKILYHFDTEVFMRSDNAMRRPTERFNKNSLSEADVDEIMAIACGEHYII